MFSARLLFSLFLVCAVLSAAGWLTAAEPADASPVIREIKDANGRVIAIEASPLSASALARLSQQPDGNEALGRVLSVTVDRGTSGTTNDRDQEADRASGGQVPLAGSYSVLARERALRFIPQFPFRAGQAYCAVLRPSELKQGSDVPVGEVAYRFSVAADRPLPPAEVVAVFPSAAVLPENQLRFYVHFSAPMSRGAAYGHIRLLDSQNRAVDLPFLELGEELWDAQQQRLTLLIDPGRIKRGVTPREDVGTALRSGEQYSLLVKSTWLDAQSRPLRREFTKQFRVGPPVESAIDPAQWRITAPAKGLRQPLVIDFPRPLDHALLERMITVRSSSGEKIDGDVTVSMEERRWEFRPVQAWRAGRFEVVVDTALEDLAGNRIGQAFEVDITGPITKQVVPDFVRLEFKVPTQNEMFGR